MHAKPCLLYPVTIGKAKKRVAAAGEYAHTALWGVYRQRGKLMLRSTQLRFLAIVLLAVAAASLTGVSARAFSLGNGGTAEGGNAGFADPDEQIGKMFGLDQGGEPSQVSSPAQVDAQPGKANPYKHFHVDSLTSPSPDPLSRLGN